MRLAALLYDRKIRDLFWQVAVLGGLVATGVYFVRNASENMVKAGIASGFDFLGRTSGIDVPFVLTSYHPSDSLLALFWAGVANTLFVTLIAMVLASVLGFLIGLARLSNHWLLSTLAGGYIEFVRNIPLLFFVLFWYFGVIAALPPPRESIGFFGIAFLNNRGLTVPASESLSAFGWALIVILAAALAHWAFARFAHRRKQATGQDAPVMPCC
jgi:general L-amino acid transport system permease protein